MNLKTIKPIGWVLIAGLVIAGICLFSVFGGLRNLFGGGSDLPTTGRNTPSGELGRLYTAVEVDSQGCPLETETQFYRDEVIYAGIGESYIPQGTTMFMRLYYEGRAVEDTPEVQADRDLETCVWFEFVPRGQAGFDPGNYEAELYVNGNEAGAVRFQVVNEGSAGGVLPGSAAGSPDLGRVYTSLEVDQNGCPGDTTNQFYPEEPVYVSMDESYLPAGTEVFARLSRDGQVVEDTDAIVADRDIETCVWFVFEGARGSGLLLGSYQAEIYVNGQAVDRLSFRVIE